MKNIGLSCLLLMNVSGVKGQNTMSSAGIYIDSIPLFIESRLFVDSLYPVNTFITLAEGIRISLLQRRDTIYGDSHFRLVNACIKKGELHKIEYRFIYNNHFPASWKALPNESLLMDTGLKLLEKIVLQFRRKGSHRITQQTIFNRPNWMPFLIGYREKNASDSLDRKLKSKAAYQTKRVLPDFDPVKTNNVTVLPGKELEFQFMNPDINKDSSIEYRIRELNNPVMVDWKLSGHLLYLNEIVPNHVYVLEVRYAGMDAIKTYRIHALAFWWQKTWTICLFSIIGAMLIIGLPYGVKKYLMKRAREEKERIEEKLKHSQAKVPTHFVSNTISTISGLVADHEPEKAEAGLINLSDMMRYRLNNSNRLLISLSEELGILQNYISIEQLRFEFGYVQQVDSQLDSDLIEIPHLLLQPSIENAVKHGVSGLGKDGMITLSVVKKGDDLIIAIKDNGKFQKETSRPGHGIVLTKDLITNLQKLYPNEKIDYKLEYTDEGTVAKFYFEHWLL